MVARYGSFSTLSPGRIAEGCCEMRRAASKSSFSTLSPGRIAEGDLGELRAGDRQPFSTLSPGRIAEGREDKRLMHIEIDFQYPLSGSYS